MSRQNKAAKKSLESKKFKSGGPAKTAAKHGKSKDKRWFLNGITAAGKQALKIKVSVS